MGNCGRSGSAGNCGLYTEEENHCFPSDSPGTGLNAAVEQPGGAEAPCAYRRAKRCQIRIGKRAIDHGILCTYVPCGASRTPRSSLAIRQEKLSKHRYPIKDDRS